MDRVCHHDIVATVQYAVRKIRCVHLISTERLCSKMGMVLPISAEHLCSNVVMGWSMDMLTASQLVWSHHEMVSVTSVHIRSSSGNQFGVLLANAHAHVLYQKMFCNTSWNMTCIASGGKDSYPVMDGHVAMNQSLQTWMKTDSLWCKRQRCQFCLMLTELFGDVYTELYPPTFHTTEMYMCHAR